MGRQLTLLEIYFSFKGRVSSQTYWSLYVVPVIMHLLFIQTFIGILINYDNTELIRTALVGTLIPTIWIHLAVQWKRWHDIGKSGWLTLLFLIPGIGFVSFIIGGVLASDPNENKYGAPQI